MFFENKGSRIFSAGSFKLFFEHNGWTQCGKPVAEQELQLMLWTCGADERINTHMHRDTGLALLLSNTEYTQSVLHSLPVLFKDCLH